LQQLQTLLRSAAAQHLTASAGTAFLQAADRVHRMHNFDADTDASMQLNMLLSGAHMCWFAVGALKTKVSYAWARTAWPWSSNEGR
jgi:hypothetical protein